MPASSTDMKVKTGLIRVFTALLLGIYVLGIAGFDIHSCLASGKSFVVPLWDGELSCREIHPADFCADGDCCGNCGHGCCAGEDGRTDRNDTRSDGSAHQSGLSERCCSDAFHYLELTGSTSNHEQVSEALSCPETFNLSIHAPQNLFRAADICPEVSSGFLLSGHRPQKPDFLALISVFRL